YESVERAGSRESESIDLLAVVEHVLLRRERTHAVSQEDEWRSAVFVPGNAAQPDHVLHEQVEATLPEISELCGRPRGAAVSAVVVAIDGETGRHQSIDQFGVSSDVLAHAMGDLDHAADGLATIPADARHAQSVRAGESKFGRRHRCASGATGAPRCHAVV